MTTIDIPAPPNFCGQCGAEYENIGHPLRPGVIMMRRCKCEIVSQPIANGTITMIVPPKK